MNTRAFIQNLLAEHTGNEENFNEKGYPKYPPSEDIFRKSQFEKESNMDTFSSPVDPYGNVSFGFNDPEDRNTGNSDINLFIPSSQMEDRQEAVRSEFKKNNPDG
jgi:hypothetical protein